MVLTRHINEKGCSTAAHTWKRGRPRRQDLGLRGTETGRRAASRRAAQPSPPQGSGGAAEEVAPELRRLGAAEEDTPIRRRLGRGGAAERLQGSAPPDCGRTWASADVGGRWGAAANQPSLSLPAPRTHAPWISLLLHSEDEKEEQVLGPGYSVGRLPQDLTHMLLRATHNRIEAKRPPPRSRWPDRGRAPSSMPPLAAHRRGGYAEDQGRGGVARRQP